MIRLRRDLFEICTCDRQSHFEASTAVCAVERVVQVLVLFSMRVCARLQETGVVTVKLRR